MSTVCSYGRPLIAWTIVAKILHHTIQYSWDIEYIETHVCTVLRKVSGWSWGGRERGGKCGGSLEQLGQLAGCEVCEPGVYEEVGLAGVNDVLWEVAP